MTTVSPPVITANGTPLDPSLVILPLVIRHGRSGTDSQPDAPSATFTFSGASTPFALGDPVQIDLALPVAGTSGTWGDLDIAWADLGHTWDGAQRSAARRFTGSITAMQAREDDGDVTEWTVQCLGIQARLGNIRYRAARPAETDVARFEAICTAAGVPFGVLGSDTVPLMADSIDRDCLSAIYEICNSTGGLLVNARDGTMYYGTAQHRDTDPEAILPNGAVLDGVAWDTTSGDVVNHVVVAYGFDGTEPPPGTWAWADSEVMADPGSGNLRAVAGGTQFAVSRYADSGTDTARYWTKVNPGDNMYLQEQIDSANAGRYTIDAIADNGSWYLIDTTPLESEGTGPKKNNTVVVQLSLASTRSQSTYLDQTSIDKWGFRHVEIDTLLPDQVAANEFGNTILVRRTSPFWRMPGVVVRSDVCTDAEYWEANLVSVSSGVLLSVPPAPGPVAGTPDVWTVEGWVETWDTNSMQRLQIAVSDRARWGSYALRRYADMALDPWSHWSANYTWLSLLTESA